jgi:hypothetical protein
MLCRFIDLQTIDEYDDGKFARWNLTSRKKLRRDVSPETFDVVVQELGLGEEHDQLQEGKEKPNGEYS